MFAAHGLSGPRITSLFVLWSVVTSAAEVPSGALADAMSRRRLLTLAMLLRGLAFTTWVLAPGYPGFLTGFVLLGAGSAFTSGTAQALVYDELAALDRTAAYAPLMARAGVARLAGNGLSAALATPLYLLGGYRLVGLASVASCAAGALLAASLPEAPRVRAAGGYLGTLRAGLREAAGRRAVRRLVVLSAVLLGLWETVDEYFPLLAGADGVPVAYVPLVLALLVPLFQALCQAGAGTIAGRRGVPGPAALAATLAMAAALLAASALLHNPAGLLLAAVPQGLAIAVQVLLDARLQDAIDGPARATVTSVAGLGAEIAALTFFGSYAAGSATGAGVPTLIGLYAVPAAVLAALTLRWLPRTPGRATMAR